MWSSYLSFQRCLSNWNCFNSFIVSCGASAMLDPSLAVCETRIVRGYITQINIWLHFLKENPPSTFSLTKFITTWFSSISIPIWSYVPKTTVSPLSIVPLSIACSPVKTLINVDSREQIIREILEVYNRIRYNKKGCKLTTHTVGPNNTNFVPSIEVIRKVI